MWNYSPPKPCLEKVQDRVGLSPILNSPLNKMIWVYVKLSTSNRIWNIRSIRVWALCQTSFSGYPVPLRAFELLNLVNSQPFSLIYRRRSTCLSSALLLACAFSQRSFAWPLLLRPDRLITTKLLGEIKPFLLYVKVFWTGFWTLPSTVRLAFFVWGLCKTGCL